MTSVLNSSDTNVFLKSEPGSSQSRVSIELQGLRLQALYIFLLCQWGQGVLFPKLSSSPWCLWSISWHLLQFSFIPWILFASIFHLFVWGIYSNFVFFFSFLPSFSTFSTGLNCLFFVFCFFPPCFSFDPNSRYKLW